MAGPCESGEPIRKYSPRYTYKKTVRQAAAARRYQRNINLSAAADHILKGDFNMKEGKICIKGFIRKTIACLLAGILAAAVPGEIILTEQVYGAEDPLYYDEVSADGLPEDEVLQMRSGQMKSRQMRLWRVNPFR